LVQSILDEKNIDYRLVGHCNTMAKFKSFDPDTFDIAIFFNGASKAELDCLMTDGIPKTKLLMLW